MAPLPKSTARQHNVFLLCLFSSLVISFALFTWFMLLPLSQFTAHHVPRNRSHVAADIGALRASSRVVQFAHLDAYQNLSHEHDDLWRDVLPPNGGYFTVARGGNDTEKLGIAMFHQLHCLAVIRSEMQYLQEALPLLKSPAQGHSARNHGRRKIDLLQGGAENALRCFDYLRQSLLCLADETIERPKKRDNGDLFTDGMDTRVCKNWDILYRASAGSDEKPAMPNDLDLV